MLCILIQNSWNFVTETSVDKLSSYTVYSRYIAVVYIAELDLSRLDPMLDPIFWRPRARYFSRNRGNSLDPIRGRQFFVKSAHHNSLCSRLAGDSPETLNLGQNRQFFVPCDLEISWMTLKNNRAPLLCYVNLCASFESHRWIQTGVTVQKPSIRVQISNFLPRVTLKFDGWPWKTIDMIYDILYYKSRFDL